MKAYRARQEFRDEKGLSVLNRTTPPYPDPHKKKIRPRETVPGLDQDGLRRL